MSSSSMISSQGVVLATAMAVSGTVILLAIRLQKSQFPPHHSPNSHHVLRPCLSSSEGKKREKKKSNKRVHFAKDVVEPRGDGEEFRRQHINVSLKKNINHGQTSRKSSSFSPDNMVSQNKVGVVNKERGMPANRVALYNGILRDRLVQRLAYSC